MAEDLEALRAAINAKGEAIRELKASGAGKEALGPHVAELLTLKEKFKEANGGVPFDPPAEKKPKKEKKEEPPKQPEGEEKTGPSKKELKKEARKEARKAGKADAKQQSNAVASPSPALPSSSAAPASGGGVRAASPVIVAKPTIEGDVVFFSPGRPPLVSFATAKLVEAVTPVSFVAHPATQDQHGFLEPQLFLPDNTTLFGDLAIARYLARRAAPHLTGLDTFSASAVDQWLDFVQQYHQALPDSAISALLSFLNSHLELRTYIVGYHPTLADVAVYTFLQLNSFTGHLSSLPHLSRWFDLLSATDEVASAWDKVRQIGNKRAGTGGKKEAPGAALPEALCPPLEGAVEGKVVTRFPPEPSGYLHIGHAKACLLNDYYAKYYKGKMIVRFDDTNPSKEKDEYEESIKVDLKSLGVDFACVTHTSDYFKEIEQLAVQMIKEGKAYMDNTPQEQMQEERMNRVESVNRNVDVETNLKRFMDLLETGNKEYCLRAKIDMSSVNGTMRDPVLYRANPTPHHRTGTKFKAYPTYDFACPIVDSVEGVTHALRTTEYNDRDEQYYWIQNALKLRPVKIQSFARMNFVQTELSKRKLTWFVDQKIVDGWDDPRFPTIQGVMRRGVAVDALRAFILSQGASRRTVMMEWDSFWAINKKGYEYSAPRYMAVFAESSVPITLTNGPKDPTGILIQLHPKRPEMGNRVLRTASRVLIEGQDADTLSEGEEITLTRWGNIKISKLVKEGGHVKALEAEYLPNGDPRTTEKRLTWIADVEDTVPVVMTEFDYLISKKKLEEDEDFKDFINPVTKAEVRGIGDPNLRNLKKGEVVQLERRGFYICDRPYMSTDKPCILFMIPDGRTKAMSTLTGALRHV